MGLRAAASMSGSSAVEAERVTVCRYAGESEMGVIMALIDDELSEPYTVYTYRYFLNQWPHLCFLAHSGSPRRAVGVVICKLDRHFKGKRFMRGYIGMLSVQPDHRGRGIATRLLKVALAELVSLGAQEVVLETETDNVSSLNLYENLGFQREKRLFNFYLNGKDCFRLVLEIPREHWVQTAGDEGRGSAGRRWGTVAQDQESPPRTLFSDMQVA